jgi:hypothetical protein
MCKITFLSKKKKMIQNFKNGELSGMKWKLKNALNFQQKMRAL